MEVDAGAGGGVDGQCAADGADAVADVAQPVTGVDGVGVAAVAVVAQIEGEPVLIAEGEGDAGVGAGVFGGVLQSFQAAEVHRGFGLRRVTADVVAAQGDR